MLLLHFVSLLSATLLLKECIEPKRRSKIIQNEVVDKDLRGLHLNNTGATARRKWRRIINSRLIRLIVMTGVVT